MEILLIRPKPPKETIGLQHVMICEPLELEYLAGNIPKDKANVRIVDMILEKKSLEYFVKKYQPDIVGITGYITHVGVIKNYAKRIKTINPSTITVAGGVHAEVVPEDFLDEHIDFIIETDPIGTFDRIVDYTIERNEKIKDIQSHKNDKQLTTKERKQRLQESLQDFAIEDYFAGPFIQGVYKKGILQEKSVDFDYLPPNRSSVDNYRKKYYYMFHNPCALVKTSFGCPYDCSFCFCKEVTGGKYFARPLKEVIKELKQIPQREIYIVDDDFLFDPQRLSEFCDALEQEQLDKRFLVYGRADFIANNEALIGRLANNGLSAVIVGIESVRQKDLLDFNKKTTIETNEKAIAILKKYDIELYATLILHLDYSKEDFRELEDFIKKMDISFVNLQPLTPLPGTGIYPEYKDKITVSREDYAKWDLAHLVLKPEHMSARAYYYQIIRLYHRVIMRPKIIGRMIGKYGLGQVLKMSWGSGFVTRQYMGKIIQGK